MEFSLSNRYVKGSRCFLSHVEWTVRDPDSKEGRISLQCLNSGSRFISKAERMSESPVETLEKAIVLRLICIGGITSLRYLERHTEFKDSKVTMPDTF